MLFKNYPNLILLLFLLPIGFSYTATAALKVALVIGNSSYKDAPLKNPVNDANDISKMLSSMGFDVIKGIDLDRRQLRLNIREFGKRLKHSEMGFFYYAGHGVQYNGENYLVPLNTDITSEAEIADEAISSNSVLRHMQNADNKVNIVILDACRNNPFASSFRSPTQGLTSMYGPVGSYIAYATAPGKEAADGKGKNGLYTQYLLKYMKNTEMTIEQVMKKVRIAVTKSTNGKQVPWENSSLMGDFYFNIDGVFEQNKSVIEGIGYLPETDDDNSFSEILIKQTFIIYAALAIVLLALILLFIRTKRHEKQLSTAKKKQQAVIKTSQPADNSHLTDVLAMGQLLNATNNKYICDLLADKEISFGRDIKADIVINQVDISRIHTKIGWNVQKEQFWIMDLNSTNGTFLANSQGEYTQIPPMQRILLKSKQLFYLLDKTNNYYVINNESLGADETVSVDSAQQVIATPDTSETLPLVKAKEDIKCYIKKMKNDKEALDDVLFSLTSTSHIILGRDKKADIYINDQMVSRRHAEIFWDNQTQKCMLKDLGSPNGCWTISDKQLPANKNVALPNRCVFYLANRENSFTITYL
jgi:pSer/pThr/pTyr-binding forkhead associated (FHA) protein